MDSSIPIQLNKGLKALGLPLTEHTQASLITYLNLLVRWNRVHNLTAIRNLSDMVRYHLLDSLAILPYLKGLHLIDIGSGAGLPGIPIALACPHRHVTLLEAQQKKAAFLQYAVSLLEIDNGTVICERSDTYHPPVQFDTVISRAVGSLNSFLSVTKHLAAPNGQWLAMKGNPPDQATLAQLNQPSIVKTLGVPGISGNRCVVIVQANKFGQ